MEQSQLYGLFGWKYCMNICRNLARGSGKRCNDFQNSQMCQDSTHYFSLHNSFYDFFSAVYCASTLMSLLRVIDIIIIGRKVFMGVPLARPEGPGWSCDSWSNSRVACMHMGVNYAHAQGKRLQRLAELLVYPWCAFWAGNCRLGLRSAPFLFGVEYSISRYSFWKLSIRYTVVKYAYIARWYYFEESDCSISSLFIIHLPLCEKVAEYADSLALHIRPSQSIPVSADYVLQQKRLGSSRWGFGVAQNKDTNTFEHFSSPAS